MIQNLSQQTQYPLWNQSKILALFILSCFQYRFLRQHRCITSLPWRPQRKIPMIPQDLVWLSPNWTRTITFVSKHFQIGKNKKARTLVSIVLDILLRVGPHTDMLGSISSIPRRFFQPEDHSYSNDGQFPLDQLWRFHGMYDLRIPSSHHMICSERVSYDQSTHNQSTRTLLSIFQVPRQIAGEISNQWDFDIPQTALRSRSVCPGQMRILWVNRRTQNRSVNFTEFRCRFTKRDNLRRTHKCEIQRVKEQQHPLTLELRKWDGIKISAWHQCLNAEWRCLWTHHHVGNT